MSSFFAVVLRPPAPLVLTSFPAIACSSLHLLLQHRPQQTGAAQGQGSRYHQAARCPGRSASRQEKRRNFSRRLTVPYFLWTSRVAALVSKGSTELSASSRSS